MKPENRIISAAAHLLSKEGISAVTTRAVSAAAKVQPPTIYRLFGDMQGLLDAVASREFDSYLASKRTRPVHPDAVEDLRKGWDHHVEFALSHPAIYNLMVCKPGMSRESEAVEQGHHILRRMIERVAEEGRLTVPVEQAQAMWSSACQGVAIRLISLPDGERDLTLSRATREALLTSITTRPQGDAQPRDSDSLVRQRAIALKAVLDHSTALSEAESRLFREWLDRLAAIPPEDKRD